MNNKQFIKRLQRLKKNTQNRLTKRHLSIMDIFDILGHTGLDIDKLIENIEKED